MVRMYYVVFRVDKYCIPRSTQWDNQICEILVNHIIHVYGERLFTEAQMRSEERKHFETVGSENSWIGWVVQGTS